MFPPKLLFETPTEVATAKAVELATSGFSPDTINVSVVGEVETPGTIKVTPKTTLNQALLTVGGFKGSRTKRSSLDLIGLILMAQFPNRQYRLI